jgi:hypothetical protein
MMIFAAAPAAADPDFAFDPSTGMFRPTPKVAARSGDIRAVAARSGRYEITINVTQSYPAPSGAKPICNATVSAFGAAGTAYQESGTYVATASGASWRCRVIIPYSWPQVETSAPVALTIMVHSGNDGSRARTHMRILPTAQVPADGAVTKINHAVTL